MATSIRAFDAMMDAVKSGNDDDLPSPSHPTDAAIFGGSVGGHPPPSIGGGVGHHASATLRGAAATDRVPQVAIIGDEQLVSQVRTGRVFERVRRAGRQQSIHLSMVVTGILRLEKGRRGHRASRVARIFISPPLLSRVHDLPFPLCD